MSLEPITAGSAPQDAVKLLAVSFRDQPQFVDMFPDRTVRERALSHLFGALITDAAQHGRIDVAHLGGRPGGVAVWYPPHHYPMTPARQLRTLPAMLRVGAAAPMSISRVLRFQLALARLLPAQPYWYLAAIGVGPDAQGNGIGTRLLVHGLAEVDASGHPSYLETQTTRNVDWYRLHGFRARETRIVLTPGGPPNWTMYRPSVDSRGGT